VHTQDFLTADDIGVRHDHMTIESARAQKRGIEHVGTVGRSDQDHALVGFKAVHLHQQLVECLLALVIASAEPGAAMASDRVDFVDKDDAGCILLGLLEHVAHAACADADEHFDEIGARDREEGNIRFACNGTRKQRLTGARRADQQHALGDAPAETLEFLRVTQKFDDLLQLVLGLVDARDVLERHAAVTFGQQLCLRFADAGLHLAHEEDPHRDQQQHREPREQDPENRVHARAWLVIAELDTLGVKLVVERARILVEADARLKGAIVLVTPGDDVALDRDLLDGAIVDLRKKVRIRHRRTGGMLRLILEQIEQRDEQQRDDDPDGKIT